MTTAFPSQLAIDSFLLFMPIKVSEMLDRLRADGWVQVAQRGSHRQFGTPPSRAGSRWRASRAEYSEASWSPQGRFMKYAVVIEKTARNYSAFVPDLPGCAATGDSIAEVESEISAAIRFHLDGLREDGLTIPAGSCHVHDVDTAA
jgi:predicted RNase H-like HicB family nuclease